jgi:hypothetical protein
MSPSTPDLAIAVAKPSFKTRSKGNPFVHEPERLLAILDESATADRQLVVYLTVETASQE